MQGYLNNPQATAEAIDSQGWFHTGDIGAITPEGFLKITDRKKDLIKTSGGKMVAPQNMEALLKSDPWISDCMIIGDKKKYISALIVPNFARVEAFAAKNHISSSQPADLIQQQLIIDLLWERVQTINQKLASFEQIKKISLLAEPFTLQAGELTPTMKVKRLIIAERYAKQIEAMYRE